MHADSVCLNGQQVTYHKKIRQQRWTRKTEMHSSQEATSTMRKKRCS